MAWTTGEILAVVVIVIIFFVIVALLIWYLLVRKPATTISQFCSTDSDCGSGFYCGGGGICVKGTSGRTQGQTCSADHQCEVGLLCTNGKCQTETTVLPIPLNPVSSDDFATRVGATQSSDMVTTSSFGSGFPQGGCNAGGRRSRRRTRRYDSDTEDEYCDDVDIGDIGPGCFSFSSKRIVSTVRGMQYYLEVTSMGSRWTSTSTQTFDYDCSTKRLASAGYYIYVAMDGNLTLSRESSLISINRRGSGYVMQDRYGNVLSVSSSGSELNAYFSDPINYPSSSTSGALPVLFEIR